MRYSRKRAITAYDLGVFLRQRPLGTAETAHQPSSGLSPGRSPNTSAVIRERLAEGIGYAGCTGDS